MVQNEIVTVQRRIQELCHIKERIISDSILWLKNVHLCLKKLIWDVASFIEFNTEQSQFLKRHAKLLLNISNLGKRGSIQLWLLVNKVSFTTVVVTDSEFQKRFPEYFRFHKTKGDFQELKLYDSSLLDIFYYIL